MESGRIQALIIATAPGNVVYERFYQNFTEQDKAELRAALAEAAETSSESEPNGTEYATRYGNCTAAYREEGDLWYFAVGDGEYDELTLAEVIKALIIALKDAFKKTPSEQLLFDNYGRMCLVIDELIYEGLLDKVDPVSIQRGIAMKVD